jgi:hypothetical protein
MSIDGGDVIKQHVQNCTSLYWRLTPPAAVSGGMTANRQLRTDPAPRADRKQEPVNSSHPVPENVPCC